MKVAVNLVRNSAQNSKGRINVVLRFSALGDLILTTGFLEKLRQSRPEEEILFVSSPEFRDLISDSFFTNCRLLFVTRSRWGALGFFFRGFKAFSQIQLLGTKSVELFDLHNVPKSRMWSAGFKLAAFLNSGEVTEKTIDKKRWDRWKLLKFKKHRGHNFSVYQQSQTLLPGPELFLPKLKNHGDRHANFSILMALDAQHWKKIWPRDHWIQLISLLHNSNLKNIQLTLVGKSSEVPAMIPDSLLASGKIAVDNLVGKTQLKDLADIAHRHHVCICGNTAWQHISESVGTPVISFVGPLDSEFGFSPFLPTSSELSVSLECRPCTLHGGGACKLSGDRFHACMKEITPQQVLSKILLIGASHQ